MHKNITCLWEEKNLEQDRLTLDGGGSGYEI